MKKKMIVAPKHKRKKKIPEDSFTDEQLNVFMEEPFPIYDLFDNNMEVTPLPPITEQTKATIQRVMAELHDHLGIEIPVTKTGSEYYPEPLREALPLIQEADTTLAQTNDDLYGWIQLYSGRKFFPLKPRVEDVDIQDIAHSLSNMCRFTGHVREFYSVAQHSVLVSYLCGANNALYGLLHDATEAYLVDMPKPIKRLETFSNFRDIEASIMVVIAKKFGLPNVEPPAVKQADIKILATEARDLMAPLHPDWKQPCEPYPFKIEPLSPSEAKKLFMDRYRQLTAGE